VNALHQLESIQSRFGMKTMTPLLDNNTSGREHKIGIRVGATRGNGTAIKMFADSVKCSAGLVILWKISKNKRKFTETMKCLVRIDQDLSGAVL
jgi:hypothetical protein